MGNAAGICAFVRYHAVKLEDTAAEGPLDFMACPTALC